MFSKLASVVAAGVLAFSSLVAAQEDPRCQGDSGTNDQPWTDVYYIGGPNLEKQFCHTQHAIGITITGIQIWSDASDVNALKFYYSDGSNSDLVGTIDGTAQRLDWDYSKERIMEATLWGNGKGTALGAINIVIGNDDNKNTNSITAGRNVDGQDSFGITVNSGILLGAYGGAAGNQIRGLGLLFLKSKINSQTIENIQTKDSPEELNKQMAGIEKTVTHKADYDLDAVNTTGITTFAADEYRANTKSWTTKNSHTITAGGSWSVKGSLLGIEEVTSTYSLSYAYNREDSETNDQTSATTFKYSFNINIKDGQHIWCRATSMYGTYSGTWTGTMVLGLEDGSTWSYDTEGTVAQTVWGKVSAGCQDHEFSDDPVTAPGVAIPNKPSSKRAMKFIS